MKKLNFAFWRKNQQSDQNILRMIKKSKENFEITITYYERMSLSNDDFEKITSIIIEEVNASPYFVAMRIGEEVNPIICAVNVERGEDGSYWAVHLSDNSLEFIS